MTTHKIDVDVTFSSPEAATLAFGILHHATAAVASGCRKQLVAGMDSEEAAASFLSALLQESQPREAILALTTRLMRELLAELAEGLAVDSTPIGNRTPTQVVYDGLAAVLSKPLPVEVIEKWTLEQLDDVAGWALEVQQCRLAGRPTPEIPTCVLEANAARSSSLDKLNLEGVWTEGALTYIERTAAVSDDLSATRAALDDFHAGRTKALILNTQAGRGDSTVGEEVMGYSGQTSGHALFVGPESSNMAEFAVPTDSYLRVSVDGEERRYREVIVHEIVKGDIVSIEDFTTLCVMSNEPDTIEFYADGEEAEVDRVTLRIDGINEPDEEGDDGGPDFSVDTNGEYHDGFRSLAEMARAFHTCAPTLAAWHAGQTLPFRVVLKRARELAGLTEPLPEESEPVDDPIADEGGST